MKLSEHFSLDELCVSQTAARNNWDNTPDAAALEELKRLCATLEVIRSFIGKPLIITSGYRSQRVNKAVGSKDTSAHRFGRAADLKVYGMSPEQLMRAIIQSGVSVDQIILEFNSWVHLGLSSANKTPRNEHLIIDSTGARLFD